MMSQPPWYRWSRTINHNYLPWYTLLWRVPWVLLAVPWMLLAWVALVLVAAIHSVATLSRSPLWDEF